MKHTRPKIRIIEISGHGKQLHTTRMTWWSVMYPIKIFIFLYTLYELTKRLTIYGVPTHHDLRLTRLR